MVQRRIRITQQHVVPVRMAVPAPVEVEIHVEAGLHRLIGAPPFGNECCLGEFGADSREDVLPGADGERLAVVVVFDEAVGHVHAEAVCPAGEPEAHDVEHRLAGGQCFGAECGLLPWVFGVGEAVVEGGLAFEEVDDVGAVALGFAANEGQAVAAGDPRVGPDVAVGDGFLGVGFLDHPPDCFTIRPPPAGAEERSDSGGGLSDGGNTLDGDSSIGINGGNALSRVRT